MNQSRAPFSSKAGQLIFVIGDPQVGKSTVAQMIAETTGFQAGNCSDTIYEEIARRMGSPEISLRTMPKQEIRPLMGAVGDELVASDSTMLVRRCVERGAQIVTGIRRSEELEKSVHDYRKQGANVTVIYVNRPDKPAIKDNTTIRPEHGDIILENDWDLTTLWCRANAIGRPFSNPVSGRTMVIARGIEDAERRSRTLKIGGPVVPANSKNAMVLLNVAMRGSKDVIVVSAPFKKLHEMRPFTAEAKRRGMRLEISNPLDMPAKNTGWENGTPAEIAVSRTPEEVKASLRKHYSTPPNPRAPVFAALEQEQYYEDVMYRGAINDLIEEGFFVSKEAVRMPIAMEPRSSLTNRAMAAAISESNPPFPGQGLSNAQSR